MLRWEDRHRRRTRITLWLLELQITHKTMAKPTRTKQTAAFEVSLLQNTTRTESALEPHRLLHHGRAATKNIISEYRFFKLTHPNFHHIIPGHTLMEKNTALLCASFSVLLQSTYPTRVSLLPSNPVPQLHKFSFVPKNGGAVTGPSLARTKAAPALDTTFILSNST